jgi:hypothetical protein
MRGLLLWLIGIPIPIIIILWLIGVLHSAPFAWMINGYCFYLRARPEWTSEEASTTS